MTSETDMSAAMTMSGLGRGGPIVSRLGLGTMTFGVETDQEVAHRQLDAFVEAGGNFIDTADVYGDGESERIIGRWAKRRGGIDDLILATKGRFGPPAGSHRASRRSIVRSVDSSLIRLGVDTIDLYSVHGWDEYTPVEETLDALAALVRPLILDAGEGRCVVLVEVLGIGGDSGGRDRIRRLVRGPRVANPELAVPGREKADLVPPVRQVRDGLEGYGIAPISR